MGMCECPMCGFILDGEEEKLPDDKVIGCTKDKEFVTCYDCGNTYESDDCKIERGELKTAKEIET